MPELLVHFVRQIKPFLRSKGFAGTGVKYHIRYGANRGLIQFQSSVSSTRRQAKITVNLGVWSRSVATFDDPAVDDRNVKLDDCQWRVRLGNLLSPPRDEWWVIDESSQDLTAKHRIEEALLDLGLPELERLSTDGALRDLWLSGQSPGRTEFQRLYGLSILLSQLGPSDALPDVLRDLAQIGSRLRVPFSLAGHEQKLRAVVPIA